MTISDEELTKKLVKIIYDLKKSRLAFRKIVNETNFNQNDFPEEEYVVIGKKRFEYLTNIEDRFSKIGDIARKMYKSI